MKTATCHAPWYKIYLAMFFLLFLSSVNLSAQIGPGIVPVNPPSGGFNIDGTLKANKIAGIGDWLAGAGGTGGFVLDGTSLGSPLNGNTTFHLIDKFNSNSDNNFAGGLKFNDNPNSWSWVTNPVNDKQDFNNGLLHFSRDIRGHQWVTFAVDRHSNNGDAYIDFEFLQKGLTVNGTTGGNFVSQGTDGGRTVNDFVLTLSFTNGGTSAGFAFNRWQPIAGGFDYVDRTAAVPAGSVYAAVNAAPISGVTYSAFGGSTYDINTFAEGSVDLTALLGAVDPCLELNISSIMIKSKESQSPTATIVDFIAPQAVSLAIGNADAGPDQALCPGPNNSTDFFLNGGVTSATGTVTSATWSVVSGAATFDAGNAATSNILNPVVHVTQSPATIRLTVVTSAGCTVFDDVVLTVNTIPVCNITGADAVCAGSSTQWCAADPLTGTNTYFWTGPNGFTSSAKCIEVSVAGTYDLKILNSNGCRSGCSKTLTVNPLTTSTDTQVACDSYTWPANGQTYTQSGTYTFVSLNASGCTNTATLNLTINRSTTTSETKTACDSYIWPANGQTYNASGTYTYINTNAAGCRNTATLNLTINQSTSTTETKIACDSYIWLANNQTYTTSGTYTYSSRNAAGCTNTATLNLTINHSTTTTETQVACDTYTWLANGQRYTASGTYTYISTNAAGCTNTATLNLTINRSTTTAVESATACDSYTWNGRTYTESGTYTYLSMNAAGCTNTATLNLTINYSTRTAAETVTACDSYTWNGKTYRESGTYTYQSMNAAGCTNTATLNLTINYSTRTAAETVSACDSYTWNGKTYTESGTYSFESPNAAGCINTATLDLTIHHSSTTPVEKVTACDSLLWNGTTYTKSGTYTYLSINADHCTNTATLNLTINYSTRSATDTVTACDSYIWPANGKAYTASGIYSFESPNADHCTNTATLNLTINHSTKTAESATACDSYIWHNKTYTASGMYTYQSMNAAGCSNTATLSLTINRSTATAESVSACNSYIWHGTAYTASGTYTYLSTNAAECTNTATLTLTINKSTTSAVAVVACGSYTVNGQTYTQSGTYTYVTTNASGCPNTVTLSLTVKPTPVVTVTASGPTTLCNGLSVKLSAQGATSYVWSNGATGSTITVTGSGSYSVTGTTNGCTGVSAATLVTVSNCAVYCGRTQGFYSGTGTDCFGNTAITLINRALSIPFGGNLVAGYGARTLTIKTTEGSCLQSKLPAGTTPAVLPGTAYCATATGTAWLTDKSKFQSALYGQVLALSLNVRLDTNLRSLSLTAGNINTYAASSCTKGIAVPGTMQTYTIPQSVLSYLGANNKVSDLLALANKVLGNATPAGCTATLSDMTAACDAINKSFDGCRVLSSMSIGAPTASAKQAAPVAVSSLPQQVTNMKTQSNINTLIHAYPNPYSSVINFSIVPAETGKARLEIFDLSGRRRAVVYEGNVTAHQPLNLSYKVALYDRVNMIYKLTTAKGVEQGKLIRGE
ncbi:MAG: hypothetical protein JWN76_3224 [Chitinophagaceae bacterium]|nr:hypothetical protein [Chitinophagaceae bacterium]